MKNRAPLLTVLLGTIILLNAALTADAQSKDKAEIRQWLDQWAKAFRAHDLNAIMSMYAPDVVAYPRDEAEVVAVLDWCGSAGIPAVPFGGGSSVVGHRHRDRRR